MENKRKIPKRIFTFFLAILCTFGILFVSYIPSWADTFSIPSSVSANPPSSNVVSSGVYVYNVANSTSKYYMAMSIYYSPSYVAYFNNTLYICNNNHQSTVYRARSGFSVSSYTNWISYENFYYLTIDITDSIYNPDIPSFTDEASVLTYFYYIYNPTPTPAPATPTPAPATPTPNPYGPGPVPTIPPGEQSYTDFFTRLASDAQSAFNAIFLSWNNANSRFYSGIFFIGFPILLGIIGLVASIFFGDDD